MDVKLVESYIKVLNDRSLLVFEFEIENRGTFHSIILDCDVNFLPVVPNKRLIYNNEKFYYFDTIILKRNKKNRFYAQFEVPSVNFNKNDFVLFVKFLYYDLKPIRSFYKEFDLSGYQFKNFDGNSSNNTLSSEEYFSSTIKIIDTNNVFCLKTNVITHYQSIDYLVILIQKGLSMLNEQYSNQDNIVNKKILVCIAESLIAIIQRRVKSVYEVYPSFVSLIFNHYFSEDSSLSSPYALELVMRDIGFLRFYFSLFPGILGRVIGFSGWFYIFAGRKAAAVDDAGGTIRPFDKFVVLAPDKPNSVASDIKKMLQERNNNYDIEVVIVDANDLGKVDVLGTTNEEYNQAVIKALKTNPQGNDDQQTPIVFIPIS
ncbi:MAG: hypothetical protein N2169_01455 [bacterium]|nr:hypothetical protein [bacterium]